MLNIDDLHASVEGKQILRGLTLEVKAGEVHAIMGPNGSGKSTLAQVLAGRDSYTVCLLYTSPSPRDRTRYRMPSSA